MRYYIELNINGVIHTISQPDRPTVPELKAIIRATVDEGPVYLKCVNKDAGTFVEGINYISGVTYEETTARYRISVFTGPNDLNLINAWGRRDTSQMTDEQTTEYYELWHEYAPRRLVNG